MIVKYFIYLVDDESLYENQRKLILISNQTQELYDGFDSPEKAEEWIINNGVRSIDYTILPIYRNS